MSRGLGSQQRAVLALVDAHPQGMAISALVAHLYGADPTRAQIESVRRAVRTLAARGLVLVEQRQQAVRRRSLKRIFDLSGCRPGFCDGCGRRAPRTRLQGWHERAMRDNARHEPGWLDELAAAQASGFVHYSASPDRLTSVEPHAVDSYRARRQVVFPAHRTRAGREPEPALTSTRSPT